MWTVLAVLGFIAAILGGIWLRLRFERQRGRELERAEGAEQALKDVEAAKELGNEVEGQTEAELDADLRRDSRDRGS